MGHVNVHLMAALRTFAGLLVAAPVSAPVRGGLNWITLPKDGLSSLRLHLTHFGLLPPLVDPGQRPQSSAASRIKPSASLLPIAARFLKARDRRIVERVRRLAPGDPSRRLCIASAARRPLTLRCVLVDQRLQRLALRRKPMSVVNHLGVARNQPVPQMHHFTIERQLLDRAMTMQKNASRPDSHTRRAT